MLNFGNKEFRNLEEQVKKNMDDISFILQEEGVLNEFGIKVVGQEADVEDIPSVADYKEDNPDWSYGDTYAIGTEAPYTLYVLTRANGTHPSDYWFNIGQFPVKGDKGDKGDTGNTGATPSIYTTVGSTVTLSPGQDATATAVRSGSDANPTITFTFGIPQGVQGIQGEQGIQGIQGEQGIQGIQGEKGDPGNLYFIIGQVDDESELPSPSDVSRTAAYLVGESDPYDVYVIIGTVNNLEWINLGPIATTTMPTHVLTLDYATSGTAASATLADIVAESGAHFVQVGDVIFVSKELGVYYALYSESAEVKAAELLLNTTSGNWTITEFDLARANGDYPAMTVGNTHQILNLDDDRGSDQSKPFLLQATATDSNTTETATGPIVRFDELRGQSYGINQFCKIPTLTTRTTNGVIFTNNGDGSVSIQTEAGGATADVTLDLMGNLTRNIKVGDKYLITNFATPNNTTYYLADAYDSNVLASHSRTPYGYVKARAGNTTTVSPRIYVKSGTIISSPQTIWVMYFNLTLMFGAGNEPESYVEFARLFPKKYYALNEGSVVSSRSSKLVNIGYNVFDESLSQGDVKNSTGAIEAGSGSNCYSTHFIPVIPGQTYSIEFDAGAAKAAAGGTVYLYVHTYIEANASTWLGLMYPDNPLTASSGIARRDYTIPLNCHYILIKMYSSGSAAYLIPQSTYKINVNIKWDKSGYEAYEKKEYTLPDIELRSARNVYDTITPSGLLTRRVGVVDLGSLTWTLNTASSATYADNFYATISVPGVAKSGYDAISNVLCGRLRAGSLQRTEYAASVVPNSIAIRNSTTLQVYAPSYTTAAAFKTAMDGVYLYYELATPVESQVTGFTQNIEVDDYGTMEFVSDYPQGYLIHYPADYVAMLDDLYLKTDGDMSGIPYAELPQADGEYTLKLTIADGEPTFEWVPISGE